MSPLRASLSPTTVLGGAQEVPHAGALTQELGVDAHTEVHADALARRPLEQRDEGALAGARHHRAAEDHDVPAVLGRECPADLLGDPLEVLGGQTTARPRRRADAHERHVRVAHGLDRVGLHREPPRSHYLGDQFADPFLDDGCQAVTDERRLMWVGIDAEDDISPGSKAGSGHASDIAEPEDAQAREGVRRLDLCHTLSVVGDMAIVNGLSCTDERPCDERRGSRTNRLATITLSGGTT